MGLLLATVMSLGLMLTESHGIKPRVLLGGPHIRPCDALTVKGGHIVVESSVTVQTPSNEQSNGVEVRWDGSEATVTPADEKASEEWMRNHSLFPRLSIRHDDLYWDGKKVDLGRVNVHKIYQAFPWQGGVLISGMTTPRRGFFGSWPFKGHFIEARDLEPFCAIFFDPNTLKGEDCWLNGKLDRRFFVYPVPK